MQFNLGIQVKRAYTKSEFEQMIHETLILDSNIREDSMGFEILLSRDRRFSSAVPGDPTIVMGR